MAPWWCRSKTGRIFPDGFPCLALNGQGFFFVGEATTAGMIGAMRSGRVLPTDRQRAPRIDTPRAEREPGKVSGHPRAAVPVAMPPPPAIRPHGA